MLKRLLTNMISIKPVRSPTYNESSFRWGVFTNGTVFQEGVFNLFLNVIRELAAQQKTLIINTIRKNRYYL
jgi:hypothetical protein